MKRFIKYVLILILCVVVVNIYQMHNLFNKKVSSNFDIEKQSLSEILDNAENIKLQRKIVSLKKHYYILVDDVVVGEVTGKFMPIFGDKLEMKNMKNNVVRSEYQIKRIGPTNGKIFNISFSRLAQIVDENGQTQSYIGEEKLKDFWKLNHIQHFYNKEGEEIGSAKPNFFILSKDYKVSDKENNVDYSIDGNIFSLASKSTIYKEDNSSISEEDVIFYTIIENSIIDGKTKSSSSNSNKSK